MKKSKTPIETPLNTEEIIVQPIKNSEPAIISLHNIQFKLLKLDDFLLDPRVGHYDWTPPKPNETPVPADYSRNPFGQLVSVFVYKPYIEANGGMYDVNHGMEIGGQNTLAMRPVYGNLDRKVMGDAVIKLAPVPTLLTQYNPVTGKNDTIFKYTAKDITITNEFSNVVNRVSSQVYNESASQKINDRLTEYQGEFLAPKLSSNEANAILTGRYNSNDDPSNMTACPATKVAIRNHPEYINGNIQEYIYMTLGEVTVVNSFTNETKVIKERDNITLVAVRHISNFSLAQGHNDESTEHNKGYLVIDEEVIHKRKVHLSQVNEQTIVNNAESKYGANDETIRRALAAYQNKKQ